LQAPIEDDGQSPRSSKTFVNCLPVIVFCRGLVLRTATIGTAMIDEKIKIKCSKCSKMFRERVQKIREGFQMQCPHCLKLLTFDGSSDDNNIRRALKNAKELRTALEAARQDSARASSPADH
jgi:DNA-directed RNA polymerase subunit RPC12/RpoP